MSKRFSIVFFGLMVAVSAQAGTPEQYQALNNWCLFNYNVKGPKTAAMPQQPSDAVHFHHYCGGLEAVNRMSTGGVRYNSYGDYGMAQKEFGYVLANTPPNNYLIPEVHAALGRAHYLRRSFGEAAASMNKAIELDPRHSAVYVLLADMFIEMKRPDEARKLVQRAIEQAPINKGLRRLAKQLDVTIPEQPAPPPPQVAVDTTGAPAEAVAASSSPGAALPGRQAQQPYMAPVEIGSPTNPWCRFCTDIPPASAGSTPSTPGVISTAPR